MDPHNRARSRPLPPLDPTNPPSVARIPIALERMPTPIARPVLASECLKDDIAPREPFARVGRVAYCVVGLGLGACAAFVPMPNAALAFGAGALALVGAALPRYALRAAMAIAAALLAIALFRAAPSILLRVVAASVLASTLFVRATYRAHRGTRIALGVGIALFVLSALGTGRASGIALGAVAAASLLGFMNDQTTGGCAYWGALALAAATTSIALSRPSIPATVAAALAMLAASVGIYQLVASFIAEGERARPRGPSLTTPPANDSE